MKLRLVIPFIVLASVAFFGFIRLEGVVQDLSAEKNRAIYGECLSLDKSLDALAGTVRYVTRPLTPEDLTNQSVTPERLAEVNIQRAKAQKDIINQIPDVKCIKP